MLIDAGWWWCVDLYRFCTVPEAGYDAILFVAIGMLLTSIAPRKNYALLMLLAGELGFTGWRIYLVNLFCTVVSVSTTTE